MDRRAFERHLDSSWLTFRRQLLDAYPTDPASPTPPAQLVIQSPVKSPVRTPVDSPLETGAGSWENEGLAEKNSFFTCPLLKSGLQGLSRKEVESVRDRLKLRLGVLSSKQLVSGRGLLDAVQALGLTKYSEEDMNDFVNLLGDFISLGFRLAKRGSQRSLNSFFTLEKSAMSPTGSSDVPKLGEATWHWPSTEDGPSMIRSHSVKVKRRSQNVCYDCVPAAPLQEILLSEESEVHKRIFGQKFNQYQAIREILLAGDTNRLVAELTFVRINDLAAPPESMHPIMYLEPIVAILIVGNGVMIGFQTDPRYRDWPGWVYVEMVFAMFLVLEIILRMWVLRCRAYWCGPDCWWNMFDIFLMTTSLSDIVMQLAGVVLDLEGTSLLRFCRLIRLVRIIKVFRVKIMRDLRLMVKGLVAGVRTLSLAFVLLFTVLYVIAGFATMTIGNWEQTAEIGLDKYFNNIPWSMFTAFRCFTGECTSDDGRPLQSLLAAEYGVIFVAGYVASYMLVSMGIFNLILAVYVDITMKAAKESDAMSAEQHSRESIRVARTTRELLKIFSAAYHSFRDTAVNGELMMRTPSAAAYVEEASQDQVAITKELFLLVIQDRRAQQLMDDLDLPPDRANLFEMLDADGSGTLQTSELLQGMLKIRGEVNKSDTVASLLATKAVQSLVTQVKEQNTLLLETATAMSQMQLTQLSRLAALTDTVDDAQHAEVIAKIQSLGTGFDHRAQCTPDPAAGSRISSKAFHVQAPQRPGSPLCHMEKSPSFD